MRELKNVQGLVNAAAQLCSAHDELAAAGYKDWSDEIKALIDILDAEVEWLRVSGYAGSRTITKPRISSSS